MILKGIASNEKWHIPRWMKFYLDTDIITYEINIVNGAKRSEN